MALLRGMAGRAGAHPLGIVLPMAARELFDAVALRETVATFRDLLVTHAPVVDRLNVYPVPDGDTGTNMARTVAAVADELAGADADLGSTCAAIAHGSLMGARGNSGVILSQILRGFVGVLRDDGSGSPAAVAAALAAASVAADKAVLRPIEGTILTVVRAAAGGATEAAASSSSADLAAVLGAARDAGGVALASTPELLPVLKEAGVVDAGGAGFLLLLDAARHVVDGAPLPVPDLSAEAAAAAGVVAVPDGEASSIADLRYEVMYLLDLADERIDSFKAGWGEIGDSIVVVGGEGLWNCHVHTNDIGAAIEVALDHGGRPTRIRVTDLFEEIAEEHAVREAAMSASLVAVPAHHTSSLLPPVTCAVVAVASGGGLAGLFGQLGVQGVITGGQTLNPSTAELLDAVERVNAQQVIVLPNNKNIIPVAEQLDALTTKRVAVVPTTSMPAGLAALVVYDPEQGADVNAAEMADAALGVATGEVTRAVRATSCEAGPVAEGDWIGLVRGDGIVAIGATLDGAVAALLDELVTADRELVTVVTGEGSSAASTDALTAWLGEHRPGIEVELHHGGQPLYPYLFGVE